MAAIAEGFVFAIATAANGSLFGCRDHFSGWFFHPEFSLYESRAIFDNGNLGNRCGNYLLFRWLVLKFFLFILRKIAVPLPGQRISGALVHNIDNLLTGSTLHVYPRPFGRIKYFPEFHKADGSMDTGIRLPEHGDFAVGILAIVGFGHCLKLPDFDIPETGAATMILQGNETFLKLAVAFHIFPF